MIRSLLVIVMLAFFGLTGCASKSDSQQKDVKHYQISGQVTAVNEKDQTATIKAGPIQGWMDAMTMEYPVQSKQELSGLHVGDQIKATVDVKSDANYSLSNIKLKQAGH